MRHTPLKYGINSLLSNGISHLCQLEESIYEASFNFIQMLKVHSIYKQYRTWSDAACMPGVPANSADTSIRRSMEQFYSTIFNFSVNRPNMKTKFCINSWVTPCSKCSQWLGAYTLIILDVSYFVLHSSPISFQLTRSILVEPVCLPALWKSMWTLISWLMRNRISISGFSMRRISSEPRAIRINTVVMRWAT